MKKLLWNIMATVSLLIMTTGCGTNEEGGENGEELTFTLTSTDLNCNTSKDIRVNAPFTGKTYTLTVSASAKTVWSVAVESGDLVTVSPSGEQKGNGEIQIVAAANPNETFGKKGVVIIKNNANNKPLRIYFTQSNKELYIPEGTEGQTREEFNSPDSKYNVHCMMESENIAILWDRAFTTNPLSDRIRPFDPEELLEVGEDVSTCFHRFLSTPVAHIQKGLSLPPATMPDELVTQFLNDNPDSLGVSMRIAYQRDKMYDNLRNVDICPLATVNQVLSGRVPVIFPVVKQEVPIYYTPRTYALHLKNILEIMDTYPDYFFVPIEYNPDDNVCIIVNEGSEALLVRTALPSMVLDFNHPQLVQNFQEYLYRIANEIGYADINRRKIRAQIKELINALEKV